MSSINCPFRIIPCNLDNYFAVTFIFRDIDSAPQDEWKEAVKKSTTVEKRGSRAQEK